MTYTELILLAKRIHLDTAIDEVTSSMVEFGQKALERYLVSLKIAIPEMEAFSSSVTPYIPSGINSIALPLDYLRMEYLHLTNQLPSPVITLSLGTGSGTLATGTYYYRVSATNALGETIPSLEASKAITGPEDIKIDWTQVVGATGYKVYGRTVGAEKLIATITNGATVTYTDTGSVTPLGAMPVLNTTGSTKTEVREMRSASRYAANYSTGTPASFEIIGTNINFDVIADANYAYEMLYTKSLPVLSNSVRTNLWSENYPQALLYSILAALVPASFPDDPRGPVWIKQRDVEFALMANQIKGERR